MILLYFLQNQKEVTMKWCWIILIISLLILWPSVLLGFVKFVGAMFLVGLFILIALLALFI